MKYRLVFNGELTGDVPKNECMAQLASLFGKEIVAIESELFRGKPIVVKKTSDEQVAGRYISTFQRAGAVLHFEIIGQDTGTDDLLSDAESAEEMTQEELRDTTVTRLRPPMRSVESQPVYELPTLSEDDETRRRMVISKKDDSENGHS